LGRDGKILQKGMTISIKDSKLEPFEGEDSTSMVEGKFGEPREEGLLILLFILLLLYSQEFS